MNPLREGWEALIAFFELGGEVLLPIFAVTALLWWLIIERMLYLRKQSALDAQVLLAAWRHRGERRSWWARQIRRQYVSVVHARLHRTLPTIKTLIALCPLLGLLGTVSGMIEVFDVMAAAGSGNPRAMASGVSEATIPTMAGMVAALSGLYFSARLSRAAEVRSRKFADQLGDW